MKPVFTSKSAMVQEDGAYRFVFFCDLCESSYTTGRISAVSVREAFAIAEKEARQHFNRCHECRKWVCDTHYNENVMRCMICAPQYEE